MIEQFKTGNAPVFLISLKAGGFGLNLTEADYCSCWTLVESGDRGPGRGPHAPDRPDQERHGLPAGGPGTIEEKVMALKAKKSQLFADVMEGDALTGGALTAEDLAGLFND